MRMMKGDAMRIWPCCLIAALALAGAAQAADAEDVEGCGFSGAWETNWGTMTLTQKGENVRGTYEYYDGVIKGTVSGNVMNGSWSEAPTHKPNSDAGEISLIMADDCATMTAEWQYGSAGPWKTWTGMRMSAPPMAHDSEVDSEVEPEVDLEVDHEVDPEVDAEVDVEVDAEADVDADVDADVGAGAGVDAGVQMEDYDLGGLIYGEDFSSSKSGWERRSGGDFLAAYAGGSYRVTVLPGDLWRQSLAGLDISDFVLEVEATPVSGPDDNVYGVTVRDDGAANCYAFLISGDGYYAVGEMVNGSWAGPFSWERSDAIGMGNSTNLIQVAAKGSMMAFYANGEKLADLKDDSLASGDVGLLVGSQDEGGVSVSFDNLRIWALATESVPEALIEETSEDVSEDASDDSSEEISLDTSEASSEDTAGIAEDEAEAEPEEAV